MKKIADPLCRALLGAISVASLALAVDSGARP